MQIESKEFKTINPDTIDFPIIGIGASAGGLEAIELFFKSIPTEKECEMAFVVVQHLSPDYKNILSDLVKLYTQMNVFLIEDGMKVRPNCVYIIPPNCNMAFFNGSLQLLKLMPEKRLYLPIDFFFRSLAESLYEKSICIIMSGTGTDGTLGLKAIKGEGGLVMVQSPESAKFDGMPRSALSTGLVDSVLPPEQMFEQLLNYVQSTFQKKTYLLANPKYFPENLMRKIYLIIRNQTGHDFSSYKLNTIARRVQRRMVINKFENIKNYILYLQTNQIEVQILFRELLIGVTSFFRNSDVFDFFKEGLIPKLFDKPPSSTIRIWIPACSTGEEAYSFAILLQEYMENKKQNYFVQIFATDIDEISIEKARTGIFLDSIAVDVLPQRLSKYFILENHTYRIHKVIRDMIVFAKHDIIKDPPFTKIDLISCRNLLIYFTTELQKKVILLFHYALNSNGFLVLGNSESIRELDDIFRAIEKKSKLYQKIETPNSGGIIRMIKQPFIDELAIKQKKNTVYLEKKSNTKELLERFLLNHYAPPSVLINSNFEVLYIHGRTGKYLEPALGEANLNITQMAREGLKMELISAVSKVISLGVFVRYDNLRVKGEDRQSYLINLLVHPLKKSDSSDIFILVAFEECSDKTAESQNIEVSPISDKDQWIIELERTIQTKDEYLNTTIEELETSNEELKSINEELQSANEELQSANEELETSKEEIQSVNEELTTVNTELQKKIEELSQVNNDMNNLLASTGIGTIFLNHKLDIKRFTPAATKIINLIQSDIGRPVSDIVSRLMNYQTLIQDIQKVLDTLIPKEAEVWNLDGQKYSMRIQPYRTIENVIEGVVLTFVEISK